MLINYYFGEEVGLAVHYDFLGLVKFLQIVVFLPITTTHADINHFPDNTEPKAHAVSSTVYCRCRTSTRIQSSSKFESMFITFFNFQSFL